MYLSLVRQLAIIIVLLFLSAGVYAGKNIPVPVDNINTLSKQGIPVVVFNPLSWTRTDFVEISSPFTGQKANIQITDSNSLIYAGQTKGDILCFTARDVPACGYKVFWMSKTNKPVSKNVDGTGNRLENQYFIVKVTPDKGILSSIYDKVNNREILPETGNTTILQLLNQKPGSGPDDCPLSSEKPVNFTGHSEVVVMDSGPVKANIVFDHQVGDSLVTQVINVYDAVPRIDIKMAIDWYESFTDISKPGKGFVFSVPFDIKDASLKVFAPGQIFETPSNLVDVSNQNYGITLLSDSRSKFGVFDNKIMSAPVITSRKSVEEDKEISLSIYPHKGRLSDLDALKKKMEFESPFIAHVTNRHTGSLPPVLPLIYIPTQGVLVSDFKFDDFKSVITLKLIETDNQQKDVSLFLKMPVLKIIDAAGNPLAVTGGKVSFALDKGEVKLITLVL